MRNGAHYNGGSNISCTDVVGRLYRAPRPIRGGPEVEVNINVRPFPASTGLRQCGQPGTVLHPRTPRGNQSLPPDHLCAWRHATRTGPESDHLGSTRPLAGGSGSSEGSVSPRPSWTSNFHFRVYSFLMLR